MKPEYTMSPYSGLRNIILIGSLFGFHGLLNRSLLIDGVEEIYIVTSRITIVTLILFFYCFREFIPGWTFIYALKNISSGLQSIFISTIPMFTVFWVYFFYKEEKITKLKVSSVAIGLLGLIALFLSGVTGLSEEGSLLIGGLLALLGVQGLAISNITNKKDSQIIPAKTYLLTQWIAATLISIVLFNFLGGRVVLLTQLEILKLLGLVFIDIFNYSLFFYTIKRLSATFTTLVDYVVPIVGIIVGYIFLDEVISNIFFVTLTMIFISLYLAVKDELTNSRQAK